MPPVLTPAPDPFAQPEFYSGVPLKRLIAWGIDAAIILALAVPIVVFTAFIALFFLPFLFLVLGFFYRAITLARGRATWGMRVMSLELVALDGRPVDGAVATLHTLGYTVSVSLPILQAVSVVMMLLDSHGRGLTDMVLGTTIINRAA